MIYLRLPASLSACLPLALPASWPPPSLTLPATGPPGLSPPAAPHPTNTSLPPPRPPYTDPPSPIPPISATHSPSPLPPTPSPPPSADGSLLGTVTDCEGSLRLFSLATGRLLTACEAHPGCHVHALLLTADAGVHYPPGAEPVISASDRLDADRDRTPGRFTLTGRAVTCSEDRRVRVWDLAQGLALLHRYLPAPQRGLYYCCCYYCCYYHHSYRVASPPCPVLGLGRDSGPVNPPPPSPPGCSAWSTTLHL